LFWHKILDISYGLKKFTYLYQAKSNPLVFCRHVIIGGPFPLNTICPLQDTITHDDDAVWKNTNLRLTTFDKKSYVHNMKHDHFYSTTFIYIKYTNLCFWRPIQIQSGTWLTHEPFYGYQKQTQAHRVTK
jgi:hypothetical protein